MRAALTGEHVPTLMARYFDESEDGTVVWWMTDGAPVLPDSPFLPHSVTIKDSDREQITVWDPFAGREPLRIDSATARDAEVRIEFRVELMLDSQLVTYFHQFLQGSPRLSASHRRLVTSLLRFAVSRRMGYNPAFYFLEALNRPDGRTRVFAKDAARTILALHTMDDEHFLRTDEIRPSSEAQATYMEEFGCASFEEATESYAEGFAAIAEKSQFAESPAHRVRYAALLAIAAIHRQRPATGWSELQWKCEAFDEFLARIGMEMGLERLLAVRYFAGGIDSFLPVQRGARIEKVFARIRAAVWDLEFLYMPARVLVQRPDFGVVVAYPCTADRVLGKLAASVRLEMVIAPRGDPVPVPIFGLYEPELMRAMMVRGSSRPWPSTPPRMQLSELNAIIQEQEERVIALCS